MAPTADSILRTSGECRPVCFNLLQSTAYSLERNNRVATWPVGHRHAQALCGDVWAPVASTIWLSSIWPQSFNGSCSNSFSSSPPMYGITFVEHFRPCFKRLARHRKLPDRYKPAPFFYAVFHQRVQCWYIALQAAIRFDGNKTSLGTKPSALCVIDTDVVGVDLRYDHRNRRVAMGVESVGQ